LARTNVEEIQSSLYLLEMSEVFRNIGWRGIIEHNHLRRMAVPLKTLIILINRFTDIAQSMRWHDKNTFLDHSYGIEGSRGEVAEWASLLGMSGRA
jgi:hypothetical protein